MTQDFLKLEFPFKMETHGNLQLKGTDICMDFHCKCGTHNHYDGDFAHGVVCKGCGAHYALNPAIELVEVHNVPENYFLIDIHEEQ